MGSVIIINRFILLGKCFPYLLGDLASRSRRTGVTNPPVTVSTSDCSAVMHEAARLLPGVFWLYRNRVCDALFGRLSLIRLLLSPGAFLIFCGNRGIRLFERA